MPSLSTSSSSNQPSFSPCPTLPTLPHSNPQPIKQVDHFDLVRVKERDLARKIQESIKRNAEKGKKAGSLAGERQG